MTFYLACFTRFLELCLVIVKLLPEHSVIVNTQFINNYSWDQNVTRLTETETETESGTEK